LLARCYDRIINGKQDVRTRIRAGGYVAVFDLRYRFAQTLRVLLCEYDRKPEQYAALYELGGIANESARIVHGRHELFLHIDNDKHGVFRIGSERQFYFWQNKLLSIYSSYNFNPSSCF
jgi:hypothetical protein